MGKEGIINIRVDKATKEAAEKLFESMGLNMSIAINLFLNQSLRVKGIPFEIKANENYEEMDYNYGTIKINKENISYKERDNLLYFEYNENNIVLAKEYVNASELCLYPNSWKIEKKYVLPSPIHYEESNILNFSSSGFEKLVNISKEDIVKILVIDGVDKITVHQNGKMKELLLPEFLVNGVHVVRNEELNHFLKYLNDFTEIKEFNL